MRNDKVLGRFRLGLIVESYCNLFFFRIFSLKVVRGRQEQVKDSIYNIEGFARGKNKWQCTTVLV